MALAVGARSPRHEWNQDPAREQSMEKSRSYTQEVVLMNDAGVWENERE